MQGAVSHPAMEQMKRLDLKSLQTLVMFRSKSALSNFTLYPCLWHLISLGTPAMFFKKQTWKPIGFSSNVLGNSSETWNLTDTRV